MSDLTALDPLIHAPARLRIMSTLAALGSGNTISFTRLQDLLDMTPGNLITHLRKLDEANYVDMSTSRGDTPNSSGKSTSVELTAAGRTAFENYRTALRSWLGETDS